MTVTIKDVARKAGVSISTVSRVINESKPVSPEARRKVIKAIEELGYRPNEIARSLVTKKSNVIGVIVDDIGSSYVAQIVRGIEEVGHMYNYDILLCSTYGDKEAEERFTQLLLQKQVAAIILLSEIYNEDVIAYLKFASIPFVYLNKYYNVLESPTVRINNYLASKKVMDYLIKCKHRNIAYVTQEKDIDLTVEKHKLQAYKDVMNDIKEPQIIYKVNGHTISTGYEFGREIENDIRENKITAVFCCDDEIAIGLINYCHDHNIRVPDSISIVGYGNISIASYIRPKLTTIMEPYYDIGAVSVRKLSKILSNEEPEEETIELPVQLIVRDSVKDLNN